MLSPCLHRWTKQFPTIVSKVREATRSHLPPAKLGKRKSPSSRCLGQTKPRSEPRRARTNARGRTNAARGVKVETPSRRGGREPMTVGFGSKKSSFWVVDPPNTHGTQQTVTHPSSAGPPPTQFLWKRIKHDYQPAPSKGSPGWKPLHIRDLQTGHPFEGPGRFT